MRHRLDQLRRLRVRGGAFATSLLLILSTGGGHAQQQDSAEPLQTRLRSLVEAAPAADAQRIEKTVEVDVFTVQFDGWLHPLVAAPGAEPTGWYFRGDGRHVVDPITDGEWRSLGFRSGIDDFEQLETQFTEAVLWCDSERGRELVADLATPTATDGAPRDVVAQLLTATHESPLADLPLRLLAARSNETSIATGADHWYLLTNAALPGPTLLAFDGRGVLDGEEAALYVFDNPELAKLGDAGITIGMGKDDGEGAQLLSDPGFWYSSRKREAVRAGTPFGQGAEPVLDVEQVTLRSKISRDTDLAGEAVIRASVMAFSARVLPFELVPTLRLSEVNVRRTTATTVQLGGASAEESAAPPPSETGEPQSELIPATFVQEPAAVGVAAAILLEQPVSFGDQIEITLHYSGDGVLEDDGVRTYRVGSRSEWYPNFNGHSDPAHFDLTFEVPRGNTVIAVGRPISNRTEDGRVISRWKTQTPIRIAGFNYGAFKQFEAEEKNTGYQLEVHASRGVPDLIAEINANIRAYNAPVSPDQALAVASTDYVGIVSLQGNVAEMGVSIDRLAENALADAQNSVQIYTARFGPSPFERLAITQQAEWTFGQAWPGLIYLPYTAAFPASTRRALGLPGMAQFLDEVTIHEVAHQWWGHLIGWKSYRDQWISEGFAEFSTALVIEATLGQEAYDAFWGQRRRYVLAGRFGAPAAWTGSVTLGYRAGGARSPLAYQGLAYGKGGYILHMLRGLMRDPRAEDPDGAFFAMLRDFAQTFAGRNPSTADFQATVQKHFVPQLNATGDGTVDWFFDQWVYGRSIPTITSDLKWESAGRGRYRIYGTVEQGNVGEDFISVVPFYADLGKGGVGVFGRAAFKGEMTREIDTVVELPRKPQELMVNHRYEVLAYDR